VKRRKNTKRSKGVTPNDKNSYKSTNLLPEVKMQMEKEATA